MSKVVWLLLNPTPTKVWNLFLTYQDLFINISTFMLYDFIVIYHYGQWCFLLWVAHGSKDQTGWTYTCATTLTRIRIVLRGETI